jgi:hypothetical protein
VTGVGNMQDTARNGLIQTAPAAATVGGTFQREGVPTVTTIFLEPDLLRLETPDEASAQLRHLADWGARLVVVADSPVDAWESLDLDGLRYEPSADRGRRGDWWVTADPEHCNQRPGRGVRSVLVGGTIPSSTHPTARCDIVARDLRGAVLEILSRQAMPEATATRT